MKPATVMIQTHPEIMGRGVLVIYVVDQTLINNDENNSMCKINIF